MWSLSFKTVELNDRQKIYNDENKSLYKLIDYAQKNDQVLPMGP